MGREVDRTPLSRFSHTSNFCYLTACFALCCVGYDSTHDVIERSHINKKWFYLFGATCTFAYLYVRPLIRRRLGSASSGYINYSTIYISWLLISVFYHLPSLESMGINIKADVGMWLVCFLGSLCLLGSLHALYGLLVSLRLLDPRLYSPTAGPTEVWSIVVMNSVNLAVACSVYYSFCGNAPLGSLEGHGWKEAVCHKWLHPVSASSHSAFTRWVIYGEATSTNSSAGSTARDSSSGAYGAPAGGATGIPTPSPSDGWAGPAGRVWRSPAPPSSPSPAADGSAAGSGRSSSFVQIDFPLDGKGMLTIPAADLVSPIFTLWLTLLLMYAVNCVVDYLAAVTLKAAYTADMRRELASRQRSSRRHQRRRSADNAHDARLRGAASWGSVSGVSEEGAPASVRDALSSLAARGSFDTLLRTMSSVGYMLGSPTTTMRRASSMLFRDDFGVGLATSWLHPAGGSSGGVAAAAAAAASAGGRGGGPEAGVFIPPDAAQPSFLPMFPWYSGTSADLIKTLFDLLISVRVFLGRFDMRTMQAAIAPRPVGLDAPAAGGDGFTYEHLAHRDELWWDFVADTGDGGDPTYAIARCLAAPQLHVTVPPELVAAGTAGCSPEARAAASLSAGQRTLPRASLVCHGGDLAYPSPTDETFEQRLFGPYQDAFPPPGHVHPGHLVVNKPDLGPEYWAAARTAECRCGATSGGSSTCGRHRGEQGVEAQHQHQHQHQQPCRPCAKEAALRAYDGPTLFAVPGNHDWLDGLDAFQSNVQHRGWLGGWLMPQEKSYFAVRLPHGWWVFGLDLALEDDIDMCQYSYFARIAEERLGPQDQVVLIQHCPSWLVDWFWGHCTGKNLRQLVRGPLRGRARVQLAGDLHFMMRHSFQQYGPGQSPSLAPSELPTPAGTSPLGGSPAGGSPTASRLSSRSATPAPGLHRQLSPSQLHQTLVNKLGSSSGAGGDRNGATAAVPINGRAAEAAPPPQPVGLAGGGEEVGGASPQSCCSPLGVSPEQRSSLLQGSLPWQQAHKAPPLSSLGPPAVDPFGGSSGAPPLRTASDDTAMSAASAAEGWGLPPLPTGRLAGGERAPPSGGTSPPPEYVLAGSPFQSWWPGLRVRTSSSGGGAGDAAGGQGWLPQGALSAGTAAAALLASRPGVGDAAGVAGGSARSSDTFASAPGGFAGGGGAAGVAGGGTAGTAPSLPPGWHLNDPEHLIVCGAGGGFCHPTHVFCEARFRPEAHPAAGPIYIRSQQQAQQAQQAQQQQQQAAAGVLHGGGLRSYPSGSSLYSLGQRGSEAEQRRPVGGEYRCDRSFPTPAQSKRLGRANLTFRSVNNRFDIIGGLLYYLLVISVLPRCGGMAEVLEAATLREAGLAFLRSGLEAVCTIVTESYVSLATLLLVFGILLGLCRSGGIGALPGVPPLQRRRPEFHGSPLAVRARLGGLPTQLAYAGAHCLAHLASAVSLLLLLELAMEVMMRYEGVGRQGYHSLFKWYRGFEALHFPDPMGVRDLLHRCTLGLYPAVLKWVMAVFDVPEAIAVSRTAMCGGGLAAVTRLQAAAYYGGVLAYYWLLATPAVGFLFGAYLYISVNWFHCHYDEAFSSLQVPHFKGFMRFHITRAGDLEMFGLALEKVPHAWREDPRWRSPHGGGNRDVPAHHAKFPSRWVAVEEKRHVLRPPRMVVPPEAQLEVVDYLLVPGYRRR